MRKYASLTILTCAASISLVACADKVDQAQAANFTVAANDQECTVSGSEAKTGSATFEVTNSGAKVTEFYVYTTGGRVVGEVENIGPGATRKLVVQLPDPGDYKLTCKPGMVGDGISHSLKVTGDSISATDGDKVKEEAVAGYLTYVRSQTETLRAQTDIFIKAINDGDVEAAKAQFAIARTPYERIEPVAEAFPDDLDPRIDEREANLQEGDVWTGFHKIEKQLWVDNAITDDTKKDAKQLSDDIDELVKGVAASDFSVDPVQIASGAQGLLDEIANSKITGEEDVFSHTDLYDFQANLDGSRAAIASLEKVIDARDKDLLAEINKRFDDVQTLLDTYREGDGFVAYDTVDEAKRKDLSAKIDTLTEKVSTVQEVVSK